MLPAGATPAWLGVAAAVGVAAGPVLRARIFRHTVPYDERVRDACPHCRRRLLPQGWRGLLAVLPPSGRCPACRRRVGPPPGTVEAVAGVAFAALAAVGGTVLETAALWWVAAAGVALAFIDLAVHRLPDRLTLTAYAGALVLFAGAAVTADRLGTFGLAVLYGLGMALVYLLLVVVHPAGMGLGDAKFALALGLTLGWFGGGATVLGTAAGFLLAGGYAAVLLALRRAGRKDTIPHGPFMLAGALLAIVVVG
jgi:leader peptidase (prepilin peptidase)/N-methyltransferase